MNEKNNNMSDIYSRSNKYTTIYINLHSLGLIHTVRSRSAQSS